MRGLAEGGEKLERAMGVSGGIKEGVGDTGEDLGANEGVRDEVCGLALAEDLRAKLIGGGRNGHGDTIRQRALILVDEGAKKRVK
jgi:hypothetical protein